MSTEQYYFIRQLGVDDYKPCAEAIFEIQILDDESVASRCAYLGSESPRVIVIEGDGVAWPKFIDPDSITIPKPVIEAARQRQVGFGERVNEKGEILGPF